MFRREKIKPSKGLNAFLNRLFTSSSLTQYNISIKIENGTELGSEIQVKAPPTPSDGIPTLFITVSIKLGLINRIYNNEIILWLISK